MYILFLILSIICVICLAKLDKKHCIDNNQPIDKNSSYDGWLEYYNGRTNIYKILLALCFVPCLNIVVLFITGIISLVFLIHRLFNLNIFKKLF
jgi:uncharacterized membrane protein